MAASAVLPSDAESAAAAAASTATMIPANHQRSRDEINALVRLRVKERENFTVNGVVESAVPPLRTTLKFLLTKAPKYALFRPPPKAHLDERFPVLPLDWNRLQNAPASDNRIQVTWLGHASVLVQMPGGCNVLCDPVFSARCSPSQWLGPKRFRGAPCSIAELCSKINVEAVLISHNHYDHLDVNTLRDIAKHSPNTRFVVPLGLQQWFRKNVDSDLQIYEQDWHETCEIASSSGGSKIRVTAVPMRHWTNRTGDRDQTLWCGYSIQSNGRKCLFPGDTAWFDALEQVGKQYGPFDVAALPIGAYQPRDFMKYNHVNVEEAVRMKTAVQAKFALPIHWGTFALTEEPVLEPREKLVELMGDDKSFAPWLIGETKVY